MSRKGNYLFVIISRKIESTDFHEIKLKSDVSEKISIVRAFTSEHFLSRDFLNAEYLSSGLVKRAESLVFWGMAEFKQYMSQVAEKIEYDSFYWIDDSSYNRLFDQCFEGAKFYQALADKGHYVSLNKSNQLPSRNIFAKIFSGSLEG